MKTTHKHHLKDNELAMALTQAQGWFGENQRTLLVTLGAIVLVGGGVAAYATWKSNVDNKARTMLAEAMVIEEARVMPPAPPAGTTNDPLNPGGQLPGTYPTEKAKREAESAALKIGEGEVEALRLKGHARTDYVRSMQKLREWKPDADLYLCVTD